MNNFLKQYIEKNIELIENKEFDKLFTQLEMIQHRIDLASIFLESDIYYDSSVAIKEGPRKVIDKWLADMRITRKDIGTIHKGPYEDHNVAHNEYSVVLKEKLHNLPENVKEKYHIVTEHSIGWNPRTYTGKQSALIFSVN